MKLPDKVRVGETLSARWLNQVVDCLKELAKASNVGNGSSTSSIEYSGSDYRDTKYRGTGGTDLQEFRVVPFQLRLKPKQLCEVSADGNWPKIAQIKAGAIIDYMGKTYSVPEGATIYDYTEGWVDLGEFSEALTKIYCIIKQNYKGEILSANFKKAEEKFVPWGKTDTNQEGEGTLSVFIGSYQLKREEEVNRARIYQAHTGTLDLQTIQVEKLFDADEEAKEESTGSGSGAGSAAESDNYYTAPESEEYESKPAGLFRKRDEHLFIFKKLICCEGLSLVDAKNLKIKLRRANSVWPDASESQESLGEDEPVITLGGVDDIVFSKDILVPEINSGVIKIPYADTRKEVTGVISGLEVSYRAAILEDDGTVTFLGEDGSRLPQMALAADQVGGSASGSGDGPYINEIVDGVIYITIPIFQEGSLSMSMSASASESESESASYSPSETGYETGSNSASFDSESEQSLSDSASGSASESGSGSASGSASASESGSASVSASASDSVSSDSDIGSSSDVASGSNVSSDSTAGSSSSGGSSGGSSSSGGSTGEGSIPGGSIPGGSSSSGGGSIPGGGSEGGSSSSGSGCCGCDCAAKLAELEKQIAELSKRIDELEKKECTCKCGDLLGQIQAAVAAEAQAIASSINYEVSVNGAVVTTTEYGTIVADTSGSLTANGGSASSSIHYQ
ncbi:MAG: hypothetical protein IKV82_04695 [Akkermansia sp.]|nr:hypothetical protein [Akkermansia sp.]